VAQYWWEQLHEIAVQQQPVRRLPIQNGCTDSLLEISPLVTMMIPMNTNTKRGNPSRVTWCVLSVPSALKKNGAEGVVFSQPSIVMFR